nr:immunoglobulin light chain junction region [Macaca mulatta]MOV65833.1 immunoglobulin light chain junction region [Macaca mulatta]MOV66732.1 immunoglobulin light chain junction region [Macaca mulatta]MOV66740.1 immunoglobulin light chain junction region [Macaca mulatta]MOV66931.1 immunoglobulin light chain junction region [Macaca mulatta]
DYYCQVYDDSAVLF